MLALARWLEPAPVGYGTHRQLGFPSCTFVQIFGQVCPSCGMTTSWALMMRGRIGDAFTTNAGGSLLAITAIVTTPWLLGSAARGRWWLVAPKERTILMLVVAIALITILDWVRRIYY